PPHDHPCLLQDDARPRDILGRIGGSALAKYPDGINALSGNLPRQDVGLRLLPAGIQQVSAMSNATGANDHGAWMAVGDLDGMTGDVQIVAAHDQDSIGIIDRTLDGVEVP